MFRSCQFGKEDPPPMLASGPLCHSQRQQAVRGDSVVSAPVVGPAVVLHGVPCSGDSIIYPRPLGGQKSEFSFQVKLSLQQPRGAPPPAIQGWG